MSNLKSIPFLTLEDDTSRSVFQEIGLKLSLECSLEQLKKDNGIRLNIHLENLGDSRKIKDPLDFLYPSICDEEGWPVQIQNARSMKYFVNEAAVIKPAFEVISVLNKEGKDIKDTLEDNILELDAGEKLNFQIRIKNILNKKEMTNSTTPSTLEIPKGKYIVQLRILIVPIVENEKMTTFETEKLIVTIN